MKSFIFIFLTIALVVLNITLFDSPPELDGDIYIMITKIVSLVVSLIVWVSAMELIYGEDHEV